MRKGLIIILFCFFYSCASRKSSELNCNENIEFKSEFFRNIKVIDDFINLENTTVFNNLQEYEKVFNDEKLRNYELSLRFISKYSQVSYAAMLNYSRIYPIEVYQKDKEEWLKWYEKNKCKKIQFK